MEACRSTTFCLTLWHAVLTVILTVLGIVIYDLDGPIALLVAANVALLFAVALMARAGVLSETTIKRSLYWRTLPPRERPRGEAGARVAHRAVRDALLTFAKGAAAAAVVCASLAYASNGGGVSAAARSVRAAAVTQTQSDAAPSYRSSRLLPTN